MKKNLLTFFCMCFISCHVLAFNVIRDTEIENALENYIGKIFQAGNLPQENAKVILINDNSINAFVSGGQTIYVHTGLITQSNCIDDLMFVLSHETGHIIGGHITRGIIEYQKAQKTALVSTLLGGILAVASGRPDAGIAVMMGSQTSAMGGFTGYRQVEESSADRIAVDIMKKMGYSMQGFSHIMEKIQAEERLNTSEKSLNYLRTHPLTSDRKQNIQHFIDKNVSTHQDNTFNRIKAKMVAFMLEPEQAKNLYQGKTFDDLYAQSIIAYREHHLEKSMTLLNQLIQNEPQNAYLYELKGQFEFESGQLDAAVQDYQKALNLTRAPLIQIALGQALIERGNKEDYQQALIHLEQAVLSEKDTALPWRLMATAYNHNGDDAMAQYAMVEYYLTLNDYTKARQTAQKLQKTISKDSPKYQRLNDILDKIKQNEKN